LKEWETKDKQIQLLQHTMYVNWEDYSCYTSYLLCNYTRLYFP